MLRIAQKNPQRKRIEMFKEIAKKPMVGALAGFLLVGPSNVMAQSLDLFVDVWVYAAVQSSSGTVDLDLDAADFCMQRVQSLKGMSFEFKGVTQIKPRLSAFYFEKPATDTTAADSAALFCALITEPKEL